jgi:hypothetical protein
MEAHPSPRRSDHDAAACVFGNWELMAVPNIGRSPVDRNRLLLIGSAILLALVIASMIFGPGGAFVR